MSQQPPSPVITGVVQLIREGLATSLTEAVEHAKNRWWECRVRASVIEALHLELVYGTIGGSRRSEEEWLLGLLEQQQAGGRASFSSWLLAARDLEQQAAWFEEQLRLLIG